ncbi:aldo/keto reductase [Hymenobacter sp. RP-2-7]|uniref:Aldo/keto reductase n=1 Tax=Hymenobacter polaris TaxID=2682546 RepID=A0A7Y0FPJ7_9BACT|nr:aldo/keto reductase [Hymenobacter polaris]NML67711.1 aldo/keto reductase [Hymenobacter polaris]
MGTSHSASLGNRLSATAFTQMLQAAATQGVNLLDTSDFYGSGDAERLISKCLKATGLSFFVVTKAGLPRVHAPGWLSPLNQLAKKVKQRAGARPNYSAAYLVDSVQKSNRRLGVEAADALLLHEPTWDDVANSDCWEGLAQIKQRGLARYTGVSANDYRVVEAGLASGQVQLVQSQAAWGATSPAAALCRSHGIPFIGNQVLRDYRALTPKFAQQAAAIHQLPGLAGLSLAQLLIGGVLAQHQADIVLFGTGSSSHLTHNIDALRYVPSLSAAQPMLTQLLA